MNEKADSDLVKRQNRGLVLEALRHAGPLARIDLGRVTGLSLATISSISGQLIEEGLVQPLDAPGIGTPNKRGRPLTLLDLNPGAALVVAVKLSVDGVELALADFRGQVRQRQMLPIVAYDADGARFGARVADEISAFLNGNNIEARSVARIGVAVQGVAATRLGVVAWSPAFSARNIAIAGPIEQKLGIPVNLANDANMIAEALIAGGPRLNRTTAVIFIGHGVGMGLIIGGEVYHGDTGAAAEFGHMNHVPRGALCRCGRQGCIEAYAADYGILRAAEGRTGDQPPPQTAVPDTRMLALEQAARSGEPATRLAFAQAGEALGFGIARLIAVLNPSRIVLAGSGTRAMDLIKPSLRQAIADGVVEELRRGIEIDVVPIATDMIVKGTIESALRHLDREVFARGGNFETAPLLRTAG